MYWKVQDNKGDKYYMMHISDDIYTKISLTDVDKVINYNGHRTSWHICNTYVSSKLQMKEDSKENIFLHHLIMGSENEDLSSYEKTIDHINHNRLDNRRDNIRFATMSEQISIQDRRKRPSTAKCELPKEIKQSDIPKYVVYNKRCYDKENNKWREFFTIESHPKLDKAWATSKSGKISIKDKLAQAKIKLNKLMKFVGLKIESLPLNLAENANF
jgi:hypothetical protein